MSMDQRGIKISGGKLKKLEENPAPLRNSD
jgi:hypothetical protein